MIKSPSFERINYLLRPHKQIERRMIIDLLSTIKLTLPIHKYHYVGMGSIYYYDYILFHKHINIHRMTSIDNKDTINRFKFNKPYDFVNFENCSTSNYLYRHEFREPSLFWLDYDGHISGNEYLKEDISILGKNCKNEHIYIVTVNCEPPIKEQGKKDFLNEFKRYIPSSLLDIKNIIPKKFARIVQEIILNMLEESCEYNECKFFKMTSFLYQDGKMMYTLCGTFLKDANSFFEKQSNSEFVNSGRNLITNIKVPHLTYKEKFYLDENISAITELLRYSKEFWENKDLDPETTEREMDNFISKELKFELSCKDLFNYVQNYRFIPQYFETTI